MAHQTKETRKGTSKKKPSNKTTISKKAARSSSSAPAKAPSAGNGSASPTRKRGKKPNMTAYILQYPETVKPRDIVERAKSEGMKLDAGYVSTVRSKAKSAGTWPSGGSTGRTATKPSSSADTDFYRALKRVGVPRAKELIENIEAFQNA